MSTTLVPTTERKEVILYDRALSDQEIASSFERLRDPAVEVEDHGRTLPDDSDH